MEEMTNEVQPSAMFNYKEFSRDVARQRREDEERRLTVA